MQNPGPPPSASNGAEIFPGERRIETPRAVMIEYLFVIACRVDDRKPFGIVRDMALEKREYSGGNGPETDDHNRPADAPVYGDVARRCIRYNARHVCMLRKINGCYNDKIPRKLFFT